MLVLCPFSFFFFFKRQSYIREISQNEFYPKDIFWLLKDYKKLSESTSAKNLKLYLNDLGFLIGAPPMGLRSLGEGFGWSQPPAYLFLGRGEGPLAMSLFQGLFQGRAITNLFQAIRVPMGQKFHIKTICKCH